MANGDYCSHCGAPQKASRCGGCGSPIDAGSRFCATCGAPVVAGTQRQSAPLLPTPSRPHQSVLVALASVVLVAIVAGATWYLGGGRNTPPGETPVAQDPNRASTDIWSLTPSERFTRLTDRIQAAVEAGDTAQVVQFVPMAEGAWEMLAPEDRTVDARYHIALIRIQVGQIASARVQLDSLLQAAPDNLLGRYLEAEIARAGRDEPAYRTAKAAFDRDWSREIARDRPEYQAHMPLLEAFHKREGGL